MPFFPALPAQTIQAPPVAALRPYALDFRDGGGLTPQLAKELEAGLATKLVKAGVQALPGDAPGLPVLRLKASLVVKEGLTTVSVYGWSGSREEVDPQPDSEGRPQSPTPKAVCFVIVRDPALARPRLEQGLADLAWKLVPPPPVDHVPATQGPAGGVVGGAAGGVVGGSGAWLKDLQPLRVRFQPPMPPYPMFAKIAHVQGTAKVDLNIDEEGVPTEARWISGPWALADAALKYGMAWRFDPEVLRGKKVPSTFRLSVNFTLN
jgi:hypothetical protein